MDFKNNNSRKNYIYAPNTSLSIHNSSLAFFYQINAPFQVTYEYCSGNGEEDYINVITLSPEKINYGQESTPFHSFLFQNGTPHFHDYYEFMLVLDGEIVQKIEGHDYKYGKGSCCLINRSLFHKENFITRGSILFIGLSTEMMLELMQTSSTAYFKSERYIEDTKLFQFIHEDLKHPGKKAYLNFMPISNPSAHASYFYRTTDSLMNALLFPKFGSSNIVRGIISQFFQYITSEDQYHYALITPYKNSDFLLFTKINNLIEKSRGKISRAELEAALNYSGDYMNRIVKKYTNMNLFYYSMTFRLKQAESLLISTNKPITQIVAELGFTNRTHFYSLFKQQYGITPREYRKNYFENSTTIL